MQVTAEHGPESLTADLSTVLLVVPSHRKNINQTKEPIGGKEGRKSTTNENNNNNGTGMG